MIKIFVVDNDQSLQKLYSLILKEAGLRIKFLNEYPFSIGKRFPHSECGPDGVFRLKNQKPIIPLLFTLKAVKE